MPKRRDRVQLVIEEVDTPEPSRLGDWIDGEDARLDADVRAERLARDDEHGPFVEIARTYAPADEFVRELVGAMGEFATEHARGEIEANGAATAEKERRRARREARDPNVRWRDEIEALRAWWAAQARVSRNKLEPSTRAIGASPPEPTWDQGIEIVARAIGALDERAREMLVETYLELESPMPKRSADGASFRDAAGNGLGFTSLPSAIALAHAVREGRATPPRGSNLAAGPELRWPLLVAERHAMPIEGEAGEASAHEVIAIVKAGRRALREALRGVDFDPPRECRACKGEGPCGECHGARTVRHGVKPRWLVPAPSRAEMARESEVAGALVETCEGAPIVDGVRLGCEGGYAASDEAGAMPRCDRCGRPRAAGGGAWEVAEADPAEEATT